MWNIYLPPFKSAVDAGVDFVVVRGTDGQWSSYAIELNLRKGGTTHPYLTLEFLTDGTYDAERGEPRNARLT